MPRRREKQSVMLRVTPRGLLPASGWDAELLARYRTGTVVEAELHQPQSEKLHRTLRRIVSIVADNTDKYPNGEALMDALKIKFGHFSSISLIGGGINFHPRSLAEMDGPTLARFFDHCMDVIETEVIPGFDARGLIRESHKATRVS
jgi:hypothetical protein